MGSSQRHTNLNLLFDFKESKNTNCLGRDGVAGWEASLCAENFIQFIDFGGVIMEDLHEGGLSLQYFHVNFKLLLNVEGMVDSPRSYPALL
jgi:hypothetical protein